MFYLYLFGTFQAKIDEQIITGFRSDKVRALLAYLAIESGRAHRRESLVDLFWPESDNQNGRASLRKALSNLRKIFDPWTTAQDPFFLVNQHSVQFQTQNPEIWIDASHFDKLVNTTLKHQHPALATCSSCQESLIEAVGLYQGSFLQGLSISGSENFDSWQVIQEEIFHNKVLTALDRLAKAYEAKQETEKLHRILEHQLRLSPWMENPHRQLMMLYARTGRQSQALSQYETYLEILAKELGIQPSIEMRALYEAILAGEFENESGNFLIRTLNLLRHNIPAPTSAFIGRADIIADLEQKLLSATSRLVTIFGPGGVGKTRLAQTVANHLVPRFQHGVWFIALENVTGEIAADAYLTTIGSVIARALDLPWQDQRNLLAQLSTFFQHKEILLVLDNVEHLVAPINEFILWLLEQTPKTVILVTSQVRLNNRAESIIQLSGLTLPHPAESEDQWMKNDCVQLFSLQAERTLGSYQIIPGNLPLIVELCRLLDGLPLAIEMAASLLPYFELTELVELLRQDLRMLSLQLNDVPERQRNIQAMFDYMWRLLSKAEQKALAMASIFHGEFSREALVVVTGASLSTISALVDRALIRFIRPGWFVFHSLIRQFAGLELERMSFQHAQARQRYQEYFTEFIQQRQQRLESPEQPQVLQEIKPQVDNIRRAWRWNLQQPDWTRASRMSQGLAVFYDSLGWYEDGKRTFDEALAFALQKPNHQPHQKLLRQFQFWSAHFHHKLGELDTANRILADLFSQAENMTAPENAQLRYESGMIAIQLGQIEQGIIDLKRALTTFEQVDDFLSQANTLTGLGRAWELAGRYDLAKSALEQSLEIKHRLGIPDILETSLTNLGLLLYRQGDLLAARTLLDQAAEIGEELQNFAKLGGALANLSLVETSLKNYTEAENLLQAARKIQEQAGNRLRLAIILNNLGDIANLKGDHKLAIQYLESSLEIKVSMNNHGGMVFSLIHLADAHRKLGQIQTAWPLILSALRIAKEISNLPLILATLVEAAQIMLLEENTRQALELILLVRQSPAIWQRTQDDALKLQNQLAKKLGPQAFQEIKRATQSKDLDELVDMLILMTP